jgi:hypothetical protein
VHALQCGQNSWHAFQSPQWKRTFVQISVFHSQSQIFKELFFLLLRLENFPVENQKSSEKEKKTIPYHRENLVWSALALPILCGCSTGSTSVAPHSSPPSSS